MGEFRDANGTATRIWLRIIPLLFVCYVFNYLDRVNVGFAKLDMLGDLHMGEAAYGFGAGIFFLGYIACGVPSNLILRKVGARRWLATIMVVWGALSAGLMFVRTPVDFYILRFATGAAEAGFFPGIVLYLTYWFSDAERGRVMTRFMAAIPLSGVIGGPLSGWMLTYFNHPSNGWAAWQWLFLLQGLPTIILGLILLVLLSDDPRSASWLSPGELQRLTTDLQHQDFARSSMQSTSFGEVLRHPITWIFGSIYFCVQCGVYAINFWLPTILKSASALSNGLVGALSAVPYLAATIFMLAVGHSADARREYRWHLAGPMLLGAVGLGFCAVNGGNRAWSLAGLTLGAMGTITALPLFWPLCTRRLSASSAAAGIAFINSLGQVAGFVSPYLVGWIKEYSGSAGPALLMLTVLLAAGACLVLGLPRRNEFIALAPR